MTANDHIDPTKGYTVEVPDPYLIFPSGEFSNASQFYGDWDQSKLPFLWNYKIMAVDDHDESGQPNVCYKSAMYLANVLPIVLAATALNFLA